MIPSFPPTAVASPVSSSSGTTVSALVKTPADKDKEITEDDLIAVKKILSDIPIAYVRPETSENVGSKNEDTRTQSDDTRPGSIRQAPEAGLASASQLQDQSAPELNGIHMPHRQRRSQSFDEGTLANRHVAKHQQMGTLNNAQSQAPHNQRIAQASSYEGRSHTHRHRPWIPSLDSSQQPREEAYIARNIVHVPPPQWVQQRQNETSEAAQWPGAPIVPTNNTQYTPFDRNGQRVLKRPFPPQQAHLNAGQQGYIPYHPPNKPLIPSPNVHQGNPYSQYSYQTPISPPVPVWDPYTQSFYWNILPQDHPIPVTPYSNFQPSSHMNAYRSSIHPPMPPPSHSNPNNVYCTAPNPPSQGHKYVPLDSTSTREQSHPGRITAPAPTYQDGIRTSKAEPDIYVPHRSSSLNRKDILGQNTLTREGSRRGRQQETNLDRGRSRSRSREQRHTKTMRNKDEEQGRSKRTSRQVSKVNMGVWDENQEQRILPKADKSDLGTEEVEKTVHVSSENFERIILDLEEMLNQALELAGRAVEGGTLAGGLGYSPSTRKEGAKLVKRRSTRNGYENGMKRTKSGKMRNGVTAPREGDQEKSLGLLAGPHESHSGESICLNALAPSGQKFASHDTLVAAANRQINSGISKSYSSSVMKGTGLDKGSIISGSSVEKLMSASAEAISSGLGLAGSSSRLRLALQQEEAGAGERLIDDQQLGDDGKSQHQQNYTMREVLEIGPGLLRQLSIANGTEGMNGGTTTVMDIGMHDRSRKDRESGGDEYHKYLVELSMTQNMRNEPPAGRYTGIEKGTRANRKNLQEYLGNPERKTIFAGKVNEHMRDGNPKDWSNPRVGKLAGDGMGGARSWSISKKRFLSVIMILLTAFIWGIVGGYVRNIDLSII